MLTLFLICSFLQLFFWGIAFTPFAFYRKAKAPTLPLKNAAPVSVVICARNEATNLRKHLPHILAQSYPLFEVLVVDDASEDESAEILAELAKKYPQLRVLHKKEKTSAGKKAALAFGLEQTRYDWLLLTDADGLPASGQWIEKMMQKALEKPETAIVLGFGPYFSRPECINLWIRYETAYVATQYFSAAIWGIPYMGVGRNLLYHKSLYLEHFDKLLQHQDLASGDDDLFLKAAAKGNNTQICLDPKTFVYSEPKHSLLALYKQKTRHYATATHYKPVHQLFLAVLSVSFIGFWGLAAFTFITNPIITIIAILVRISIIFVIWSKILRTLEEKNLLKYVVLLDFLSLFYYVVFAPSLFLKNRSQWK